MEIILYIIAPNSVSLDK